MKALKYYILLFLIVVGLSCAKKKYPESVVENGSVYNFSATIENTPVTFSAGVNGYYMYSSYQQDSNNVYNFIAALKQADCSDCRNSLQVQINDYETSLPGAATRIDSSLFPHTYGILSGLNNYDVRFSPSFNKQAASYYWDFGDGTTSTDTIPMHTYTKAGNYTVNFKATSYGNCESISSNVRQIGNSDNTMNVLISTNGSGYTVNFTPQVFGGKLPYTYLWRFGDGSTSTASYASHTYAILGAYPASLQVTDSNGQTVITNYNVVTLNDQSSCAANYNMAVTPNITSALQKTLSKIIVSWTDRNGVVYTSNNELQPLSSHFEIISVEDGGVNENKQPIKRLHLKFNCKVYNASKSLSIDHAETTICVAYK